LAAAFAWRKCSALRARFILATIPIKRRLGFYGHDVRARRNKSRWIETHFRRWPLRASNSWGAAPKFAIEIALLALTSYRWAHASFRLATMPILRGMALKDFRISF